MPDQESALRPTEEDAFHFIVQYLREGRTTQDSTHGYEVYLPNIMRDYLQRVGGMDPYRAPGYVKAISPAFYNAAWELCRRGILRPGLRAYGEQTTEDGGSGNGYSVTPMGRHWLRQAGQYDYVPIEPARFAKALAAFGPRFGPAFLERSQEAIRCYGANAHLACCVMCGAAAESILLALAIAETADEPAVMKDYSAAGGRGRVENLILGRQPKAVQDEFRGYTSLLKYWRDTAAHGKVSGITDNEAYTSLAVLLRFAQSANDRWTELTGKP